MNLIKESVRIIEHPINNTFGVIYFNSVGNAFYAMNKNSSCSSYYGHNKNDAISLYDELRRVE